MELDHTADLGQLKQELVRETNKKVELNKLLREAGTELTNSKKNVLDCNDVFQKIKNEIKCCEDRIKTLKTSIHSERDCGS
jgi:predicted  nucleic acid-binding Zn-ribbon protein